MGDLMASPAPQPPPSRQVSHREDCWTEEATFTLVDAWGRRYLELNRGYFRQRDWQQVADVVNARQGHTEKTFHTDAQCKNRIDALKKKYKVEKGKISQSNGTLTSSWPFFSRLEPLIESNLNQHQNKLTLSATPLQSSQSMMLLSQPSPPASVPLPCRKLPASSMVTPLILPQKRLASSTDVDESFRRNYSIAAAAAAASAEDDANMDEDDGELEGEEVKGSKDRTVKEEKKRKEGMGNLAHAIQRFGEIYEKVESMKLKQMVELEKQRMQFAKDLTVQGMQLFMDTAAQLEKLKQAK
ncbi:Transcription factor GT-2 [Handroanthus impetiginosus]|uniref:Transcription factor GT-2 n=1 Tax=Handroanthus impetiginosus TaxID=429701 RepID=A0A2G9GU15_9LAMI|nr:Transcription factor GT-2 [Handroanthus impetiginosus]